MDRLQCHLTIITLHIYHNQNIFQADGMGESSEPPITEADKTSTVYLAA